MTYDEIIEIIGKARLAGSQLTPITETVNKKGNKMSFYQCDIVQLLSGGPLMTVIDDTYENGKDMTHVMWFDTYGQLQEAKIESQFLVKK